MKIVSVHARQILDSRGNPTVETDLTLEDGSLGRASVPSGASTGINEALELRDGDETKFLGKGVLNAVKNVNLKIAPAFRDQQFQDQAELDKALHFLDGTDNKSNLGANAILSVSLAFAKAASLQQKIPLYKYFNSLVTYEPRFLLPVPMINIINGGKHGGWASDIQEFMILPAGAPNFSEAIRMGSEVFHNLGKILEEEGYPTTVGDEGGYAPKFKKGNTEALELIQKAVQKSGYKLGQDIFLGLDVAASEFFKDGFYSLKAEGKNYTNQQMIQWLEELTQKFPIVSIEDALDQQDWFGWKNLSQKLGDKIQLVGDDLLVTNIKFLKKAIDLKAANAILIKLNQIGTVTETIQAIEMAHQNNWNFIISHRSGETEDTSIAHLAVGLGAGQIKTGSVSRTDRVAKYNELLRIEEELGEKAEYTGKNALKEGGILDRV